MDVCIVGANQHSPNITKQHSSNITNQHSPIITNNRGNNQANIDFHTLLHHHSAIIQLFCTMTVQFCYICKKLYSYGKVV